MKIFLEDSFDSAHYLPHVPEGHKCRNMHGHTYRVRMEISGPVIPVLGWIMDYTDVKDVWGTVKNLIDHKTLNDIKGLENSTCENLTEWIWARLKISLPGICRLEVRETERCGCVKEIA